MKMFLFILRFVKKELPDIIDLSLIFNTLLNQSTVPFLLKEKKLGDEVSADVDANAKYLFCSPKPKIIHFL